MRNRTSDLPIPRSDALPLNHRDSMVTLVTMVTFMNVFVTPKICFQFGMRQGHSFISLQKFYRKGYEDLPPEELSVGVVVPLLVGSTSVLLPFIELT